MDSWHIHIQGRVQGVGFRPYVYRLAQEKELNGVVYNSEDGVHIKVLATEVRAKAFYSQILEQPPAKAKITKSSILATERSAYQDFQIIENQEENTATLQLTPDFALCENCRKEVSTTENRRAFYPFITCTECGPRYSIIKKLPFERNFTAMDSFEMCPSCHEEYTSPEDRRYHSQTNSCAACGIKLSLLNGEGREIEHDPRAIVKKVVPLWSQGEIIAIKGIGGYLLTCDASNAKAVHTLRNRKNRPSKPFACMYPNLESIQADFHIASSELQTLTNAVAPIVLLGLKKNQPQIALNEIAPGLDQIGVMMPYTPLYELLLQEFGKPIVATSGNISSASIVYEDDQVFSELSGIWDYVLTNNREIISSQDDSVMRITPRKKQSILIRRSRGLAPNYFDFNAVSKKTILALGASQKSAFSLLFGGQLYLSQYLGDLAHYESTENFVKTINHYLTLLNCKPEIILVDQHPAYYSTQYGKQLATDWNIKLIEIQHHYAHFAAILSEHDLMDQKSEVLGVIWDGTGYGDDQHIWGGEFLTYQQEEFKRIFHLTYSPHILNDKMVDEPRISALTHCFKNKEALPFLQEKFTAREWALYHKILAKENPIMTSSIGRLFDAVASLLGLMDVQTYEGEAALKLETIAQRYFDTLETNDQPHYISQKSYIEEVPKDEIIAGIIADLKNGLSKEQIAFKFHYSLVKIVEKIVAGTDARKIAFSGGVFQNGLLVDLMLIHLEENFQLYFHEQVSPNDENIALGQLAYYQILERT